MNLMNRKKLIKAMNALEMSFQAVGLHYSVCVFQDGVIHVRRHNGDAYRGFTIGMDGVTEELHDVIAMVACRIAIYESTVKANIQQSIVSDLDNKRPPQW